MEFVFNSKRFVDNVNYFLKEHGERIGEFEKKANLTAGYISRLAKAEGGKPNLETAVNIADAIGIGLDAMLKTDFASLSATERYLLNFLTKLEKSTINEKLDWKKETASFLNNPSTDRTGYPEHPLFSLEQTGIDDASGYTNCVSVFKSNTFDMNTAFFEDCFYLEMKNDSYFYLMSVIEADKLLEGDAKTAREIWMWSGDSGRVFLGGGMKNDSYISEVIEKLYNSIKWYIKHPNIHRSLKTAIDAFMKDDDVGQTKTVSDEEFFEESDISF